MAAGLVDRAREAFDAEGGDWPEDVKLYQPDEDILLLSDDSSCKAVQAFLRFCDLDYKVICRTNAEFMSPTGKLPFLRLGKKLVCGVDGIIAEIQSKGLSTSLRLPEDTKSDLKAFIALVQSTFYYAELSVMWMNKENADCLRKDYGSVFPWPLNHIIPYQKCWNIQRELKIASWERKSLKDVCDEVESVCHALSERLGDNLYFSEVPAELDAIVYGHIQTILTRQLPNNPLAPILLEHRKLVNFCNRIHNQFILCSTADSWVYVGHA